nr:G patch domain-containing protein 4 [Megalopta genalis]XP_033330115.1 G patch domain-containing protein 4 [Megalopta genalis]XP_033330116.1 G patch domain-containing protein 4 [Megalopta genalis]
MDFAKAQLLKYGWTEGKGLGKDENGIANALRPKLKFDSVGIGHKDEDCNEWWATGFNDAANNIMVESQSQGVSISVSKENKNELPKHLPQNKFSYGNFLKTSTLFNGTLVQEHNSNVPEVEQNEQNFKSIFLTDQELFKVCNGRTAHKGARHGLKLNGKLKRVEEQEKNFLQMQMNKSEVNLCDTDEETLPLNLSSKEEEEEGILKQSRSEKKRKRKINDLTHQLAILCNIDDTIDTSKLKRKKRKQEKNGLINYNFDDIKKKKEGKEISDMPLSGEEKLDKRMIKKKNRKCKENRDHGSTHKKKKRTRGKKKKYQRDNLNAENENVQHHSKKNCADILDSILRTELPCNEFPSYSKNDINSFPYSSSPDTYTRNESIRLNYKISKKKKAKSLRKGKKMVQNMIENFEAVTVSDENVSGKIDSKRKLNNIIEKMIDTDIAINKTNGMDKNIKRRRSNKKRNKNSRKLKEYVERRAESSRKKKTK